MNSKFSPIKKEHWTIEKVTRNVPLHPLHNMSKYAEVRKIITEMEIGETIKIGPFENRKRAENVRAAAWNGTSNKSYRITNSLHKLGLEQGWRMISMSEEIENGKWFTFMQKINMTDEEKEELKNK